MNTTLTLISRAALVAGVITAVSAQSVSADSGDHGSSRGRSCWAHSRHKEHKHSVGHDHDRCDSDHGDDHDTDGDDRDDDSTPVTSVPTTSVPSGTGTTPDSGSSESTPSDRDARPIVETPTTTPNSSDTPPSSRVDDSTPVADDVMVANPSSPAPISGGQVLIPSTGGGEGVETPAARDLLDAPVAASPVADSIDATDSEFTETFAGGVIAGEVLNMWWLLALLVLAEALRRARRTRALDDSVA